jgi:glycerophosphoryl diester phosphodiesterase
VQKALRLNEENFSEETAMPKLIAHRGASADAPENTLRAIKEALQLNIDAVEIDVHLSKDGIPIVIHDATTRRTTNSPTTTRVEDLTLEQIKRLDAGSWFGNKFIGEKIPTLAEVLALDFNTKGLMIEIKEDHIPAVDAVSAVMSALDSQLSLPELSLGSFSPEIVNEIQRQASKAYIPMGIIEKPHLLDAFKGRQLTRFAIQYKLLNPQLIRELHEDGADVWAFTVDDIHIARFLTSIHTDGIITNVPARMRGV